MQSIQMASPLIEVFNKNNLQTEAVFVEIRRSRIIIGEIASTD